MSPTTLGGVPVHTSTAVALGQQIVGLDPADHTGRSAALWVHPDELHMVHAACGQFTLAFRELNTTIRRKINRAAATALARIGATA